MENVLLDRSSGSLEFPKRSLGRSRRGLGGARPAPPPPAGAYSSFPTWQPPYNHLQKGGGWTSATVLPYARPPLYSSPSLPLLPSSQPPLLPLPPTATKYATFPCLLTAAPPPPPPEAAPRRGTAVTVTTTVPVPAAAAPRTRERRRRPARPPSTAETPSRAQKKKPLERATPLPPAPVVTEALDDLEQEVARNFVQDLLHVLAPPPSSLPLPSFSLVMKAASSPATATAPRVVGAPVVAPSCNVEAATADGISGLLRL